MGGNRSAWGNSQRHHDALIKSLPALVKRMLDSFSAIHLNFEQIAKQSEVIARRAAQDAGIAYPVESSEPPVLVALATIVETLKGQRHLMTPDEVSFYRSAIRSILKLADRNLRESAKLAKAIKDDRECLQKIERFYSMADKPAGGGAGQSKRSARPPRRR